MTDISGTQLDEIMWANSDAGKAAFNAAWAKAKGLGIAGVGTGRVMGIDMADVGALVWAAHQATAGSEEEAGEYQNEPEDFDLTVTVRLYGGGTAEDAAKALKDYQTTFDLPGDREAEIIDATPARTQDGA